MGCFAVVPASFTAITTQNGHEIDLDEVDFIISLSDSNLGIYNFSFTPSSSGVYQVYIYNLTTNVIYTSDIYSVNNQSSIVYIGI